jgi:hypothetical protein
MWWVHLTSCPLFSNYGAQSSYLGTDGFQSPADVHLSMIAKDSECLAQSR